MRFLFPRQRPPIQVTSKLLLALLAIVGMGDRRRIGGAFSRRSQHIGWWPLPTRRSWCLRRLAWSRS